ncbi:potassium channel family protein [Shimia sediminis]|uniref:potassium channel family protein n=1 Tax=Shimia sediminis TaxID=2497945 RepID=UPI000F8CA67F|nr:potassium channel family protein [Shimia sediminis]
MSTFKTSIDRLYTGPDRSSVLFRYFMFAFDLATMIYFIAVTPFPKTELRQIINGILAIIIFFDFVARLWIAPSKKEHLSRVYVWADIIVLATLVLNPLLTVDLAFLRILRGMRLAHSFYLLQDLRGSSRFFRLREDAVVAGLNLVVFVFTTASAVFTFFVTDRHGVSAYVDALYFTVTTFTTTGYGDITPTTVGGKLMAIGIMVIGVSLFLHLARVIVMPSKVNQTCNHCGLTRHDSDAVHCKHCGAVVHIKTEGAS